MVELFTDPVLLARFQFAFVVFVHFLFVPLSIGLGLFLALAETRYYKTRDPKDKARSRFLLKIFATTFIIGVATGITMEFSFGTNWANYARYVGDIFGAPLAAEALLAFFLESVFLGIVIFGRNKISPKLYLISTWLVWFGSALSALWILLANSWMQTPAGFIDLGNKAQISDFWAAALNPSTLARYLHTVDSVIILASFCVIAIGAYYLLRHRHVEDGIRLMKTGLIVGIVAVILMLPFAHMQATVVAEQQPAKLAAMEGQWEDGPADLKLFGWVDEANQKTYGPGIPGGTSWLATWDFKVEYPGLNTTAKEVDFSTGKYPGVKLKGIETAVHDEAGNLVYNEDGSLKTETGKPVYKGGNPPVNFIFQAYHIMIALYLFLIIWLIIAGMVVKGAKVGQQHRAKAPLYLLVFGPLIPFLCIQTGWIVAEVGRQPWVVSNLLKTADAVSPVVSSFELQVTVALFVVFYTILVIAWLRIVLGLIKKGPVVEEHAAAPKVVDAKGGE